MGILNRILIPLWLFLIICPGSVKSAGFESLIMPGKVIEGHAKYEDDCDKCHETFSKKSQRRLCLNCHKEVAIDVRKQSGFHGREASMREVECKQCHSDHLGRDAKIVQFNKGLFDHDQADFQLRGVHSRLVCEACHKDNEPYRKAQTECVSCHKSQDVHEGKFNKDCSDCHNAESWSKTRFDHNKTDYALTGKHREVSCALCHPNKRYKDIPRQCNDCHYLNDIHSGSYGKKCQDCHSTKGWKGSHFDHDKKTEFPLKGKHKESKCDSCHKQDYKKELETDCYSCHKEQDSHQEILGKQCGDCHGELNWDKHRFKHEHFKKKRCYDCHEHDDEHKNRYGRECADCHTVKTWSESRYDHDRETGFPLRGKHKKTSCQSCHQGEAKNEHDKTECHLCHSRDDVHLGKQGKECQQCHNEEDWRQTIAFDHDMSRFPLVGLHATTPCEECHLSASYGDTKKECVACHKSNDIHKRSLGPRCENCHNPNSWKFWQFDHDSQSDYKLAGAHKEINCEGCHKAAVKDVVKLSGDCFSCHRGDDVHEGGFGRQCERCHNDKDFKEVTLQ